MIHPPAMPATVGLARVTSSVVLAMLALLAALCTPARAHEVQPSVMDLTLGADVATMTIDATLEPFVAGVNLEGLQDTNASDLSAEVDRLRALPPEGMAQAFREDWSAMTENLRLLVDGAPVPLTLESIEVPPVGDIERARISQFTATAPLPAGDAPVVVAWDPMLGALVVRQMEAGEDAYTGFLPSGGETPPIPRDGGTAQGFMGALIDYIPVGFAHIIPLGLDHILFVLGLFFLSMQLGPLLWQVTAFTAAHTVTLALAALGIVSVPGSIVEPLIAASIVYVGVENVLSRGMTPWRPAVVLAFGLLHGLGFASVLTEYGLGRDNFVGKLIGFNIGVEFGQLAVIAAAFVLVGVWFGSKPYYKRWIANPASLLIAAIGAYWFVERTVL